ncbi:MAG: DegT/DnrJ/EryC1/StrS family aminotransferase [Acidobacteriota bacterium]|nr:DegT/DnrJ/EryC1/StrS family aminotransferase [Acidobacteriota bacterium]
MSPTDPTSPMRNSTPVPMLDLVRAHAPLHDELEKAFRRVLASGHFVLGQEVEAFETEAAEFLGCRHAIGMSSGTDAVLAPLMALDLEPGDEVVCPSFTFFASGGCVSRAGGVPAFADVSARTFNSSASDLEAAIGERTRAILVVHLFGRCAAIEEILEMAAGHGLPVIEDTAQAFGASAGERRAGTLGIFGCYSFFPTKNLGGFGDGGLVSTDDDELAARICSLRMHGESDTYLHREIGGNFRLDALQAALLRVKLPHVDRLNQERFEIANRYCELFLETGAARSAAEYEANDTRVVLPDLGPDDGSHVCHQFVIRVPGGRRDELRAHLAERGIQANVYYPLPLHRQACFAGRQAHDRRLPVSELLALEVLALPMHPFLSLDEQQRVVDETRSFF